MCPNCSRSWIKTLIFYSRWFKKCLKRHVLWSPKGNVNKWQNWCPSWNQLKNAWTSLKKSASDGGQIHGGFLSQLSKNGATHQKNLQGKSQWLKITKKVSFCNNASEASYIYFQIHNFTEFTFQRTHKFTNINNSQNSQIHRIHRFYRIRVTTINRRMQPKIASLAML